MRSGPATLHGMAVDLETCRRLPKVLLHDHLDGGLRPATVIALADESGYAGLPSHDPVDLAAWFQREAGSGSLEHYLGTFRHTVGVMQTPAALRRVARECVEDLAADGVAYAEVRFAPELHVAGGLTMDEAVQAVLAGLDAGARTCSAAGRPIVARSILAAMRTQPHSLEVARLVVRYRDAGVVGFDIAGEEAGNPPTRHLDTFEYLQRENAHFTIHAGEAYGLPSIWEAIQFCGAERLGHGVRIVDDIAIDPDGTARLGRLAAYVRDRRIPLEMCPSSNVQTGAASSIASHPVGLLRRLGFRVTVNTDNRLMSGTSLSRELHLLARAFGYGPRDLKWLTVNAMKSAFLPFDERMALIEQVISPGHDPQAG